MRRFAGLRWWPTAKSDAYRKRGRIGLLGEGSRRGTASVHCVMPIRREKARLLPETDRKKEKKRRKKERSSRVAKEKKGLFCSLCN